MTRGAEVKRVLPLAAGVRVGLGTLVLLLNALRRAGCLWSTASPTLGTLVVSLPVLRTRKLPWGGDVAQRRKRLLGKRKDLSSISGNKTKQMLVYFT